MGRSKSNIRKDLDALAQGIQRCQRCERSMTRNHAVPGEGPARARILLFGEAPGRKEDDTGRPFVGRAGAYLNRVLGECGIGREDVFITSVLKCYHPGRPKKAQMESCLPWTEKQADAVRPAVILVMGLSAAWSLVGAHRLGAEPMDAEWRGISCIVTCHPAAAMRFPERDRQFRRDFGRMVRAIKRKKD